MSESNDNRRRHDDRRKYTIRTLQHALMQPQRHEGRRTEDRRFMVSDLYDSGILSLLVLLIVFSALDATFTLILIGQGASELNPVMNYVLQYGVTTFVVVKMIMTAVPGMILAATANVKLFNRIRSRSILAALVGLYAGVILYELGLLSLT